MDSRPPADLSSVLGRLQQALSVGCSVTSYFVLQGYDVLAARMYLTV